MKFIDWFAGVGGFRRGMELAGHECVGFCEFDKYAVMSYTAMHLCTPEQLEYLATLTLKERQKEILKDEYRNGEWYANDVRSVDARSIPDSDCWCFGFPCQDISVAGKQLGFTGNRSSLFFRVMYLVGQLEEEKRPTYLFIENVKNLLSVNGGWDFARLLAEMDRGGYDAEWQVFNSKDFGVPQNRERVFIIGFLRGKRTTTLLSEARMGAEIVQREGVHDPQRTPIYIGVGKPMKKDFIGAIIANYKTVGRRERTYICENNNLRFFTPKECFRLQGWTDDYFEKAQLVNSEAQLYKQAGNGVTVTVIEAIAKKMEGIINNE